MLNKFFGKKSADPVQANGKVKTRKSGGFLELDEKEEVKVAAEAAPVEVATAVVAEALNTAKETVTDAVENTKETVKGKTKGKKNEIKGKKNEAVTAPKEASTPEWDAPEWVKVMYKSSTTTTTVEAPTESAGFASDNLMPTPTTSRRRPGPSLNKFMDMANQVKRQGNRN